MDPKEYAKQMKSLQSRIDAKQNAFKESDAFKAFKIAETEFKNSISGLIAEKEALLTANAANVAAAERAANEKREQLKRLQSELRELNTLQGVKRGRKASK